MQKNNPKKVIGILITIVFLYFLIYTSGGLGPLTSRVKDMGSSIYAGIFSKNETPSVKTLFSQKVLNEESAVIDVVDSVSPAVVSIALKASNFNPLSGDLGEEDQGVGTGFIVDPNGLIVTNNHVVEGSEEDYTVILSDGSAYDVTKVNRDPQTDLAILEVTARNLPTVELGDSSSIKVGQTAIAIGNALGQFSNTITVGVVSGISRELTATGGYGNLHTYEGTIQTDAALNPGNSGGPLLNSAGQVIGINVATTRGADNIGFSIPVNTLKPILEGYLAMGRIVKPYLGVSYTMITPGISSLRDIPEGAYISSVLPGTPAADAGLKRGDVITEIDGTKVQGTSNLADIISKKSIGDEIKLTVDRLGEVLTLTATVSEAPENIGQ